MRREGITTNEYRLDGRGGRMGFLSNQVTLRCCVVPLLREEHPTGGGFSQSEEAIAAIWRLVFRWEWVIKYF